MQEKLHKKPTFPEIWLKKRSVAAEIKVNSRTFWNSNYKHGSLLGHSVHKTNVAVKKEPRVYIENQGYCSRVLCHKKGKSTSRKVISGKNNVQTVCDNRFAVLQTLDNDNDNFGIQDRECKTLHRNIAKRSNTIAKMNTVTDSSKR